MRCPKCKGATTIDYYSMGTEDYTIPCWYCTCYGTIKSDQVNLVMEATFRSKGAYVHEIKQGSLTIDQLYDLVLDEVYL